MTLLDRCNAETGQCEEIGSLDSEFGRAFPDNEKRLFASVRL